MESLLENFTPDDYTFLWLSAAFILAFLIAVSAFPSILYVVNKKNLVDVPDDRSEHKEVVPTLGGIGIFLSLIVVITIVGAFLNTKILLLVMGALTILFFLGLKDDLTALSASKKMIGQLFAAALLIIFTNTRIIGFSGILEVDILPYSISIVFTLFVYILIINAYNLIDGIDGLAGTFALCTGSVFVYLFVQANALSLATTAIALCGALIAFLRLNLSQKNKIFMGDTGSMVIGFLLAFFTISFINISQTNENSLYFKSSPALAYAVMFYPLVDTLRIFFIRIFIHKTSPFKADKNHIHHRYTQLGYSHINSTLIIVFINFLIICIAFNIAHLKLNSQILIITFCGTFLYFILIIIKRNIK